MFNFTYLFIYLFKLPCSDTFTSLSVSFHRQVYHSNNTFKASILSLMLAPRRYMGNQDQYVNQLIGYQYRIGSELSHLL